MTNLTSEDFYMQYQLQEQMKIAAEQGNFMLAKKLNRELIDLQSVESDGVALFYPAYIQLEHTNKCNAECIMCNHFYLENRGSLDLLPSIVEKLKPILPYCTTIRLNGVGEPFLLSNIVNFLKIYAEYGIKIGTNTNLSFITDELLETISKHFSFLDISCDGCSTATYEHIRRGLNFGLFKANLIKVNKYAPNVNKILDCVVMRQNINEVKDIVLFAKEHNFEQVRFNMLRVNPYLNNQNDSLRAFINYATLKLQQAKNVADKIGIKVFIPMERNPSFDESLANWEEKHTNFTLDEDISHKQNKLKIRLKNSKLSTDYLKKQVAYDDLYKNQYYFGKLCQWAFERCYIDLTGKLTTCCYNMLCHFGNLTDSQSGFQGLWNGQLYRAFRKNMLTGKLPYWCSSCEFILGQE